MEELLKNKVILTKIQSLTPSTRRWLIGKLLDMFQEEAEDMVEALEESRMELRGFMLDFNDESEKFRSESRMLESRRQQYEQDCVDEYMARKNRMSNGRSSRASRMSNRSLAEVNEGRVMEYMRNKQQNRKSGMESRSPTSLSVEPQQRPFSTVSSAQLLLDRGVTQDAIRKESQAIMDNLTSADRKFEDERLRQAEMIEKRRQERADRKKKTTEEKALALLEAALQMDKQNADRKKAEEQKLQERLEEIKRKKMQDNSRRENYYDEDEELDSINL